MNVSKFAAHVAFIALMIIMTSTSGAKAECSVAITNDTDYTASVSLQMNTDSPYANPNDSSYNITLYAHRSFTIPTGTYCPKRLDGTMSYGIFNKVIVSRCVKDNTESTTCPLACNVTSSNWKIQLSGADFHFNRQ